MCSKMSPFTGVINSLPLSKIVLVLNFEYAYTWDMGGPGKTRGNDSCMYFSKHSVATLRYNSKLQHKPTEHLCYEICTLCSWSASVCGAMGQRVSVSIVSSAICKIILKKLIVYSTTDYRHNNDRRFWNDWIILTQAKKKKKIISFTKERFISKHDLVCIWL